MTKEQIERFWSKVSIQGPDECWQWQASILKCGYGCFSLRHKSYRAHRVAYELTYGPIPEGLCCCHKCDNTSCVNPSHLFLGTNQDNSSDMVSKDRTFKPKGEKHSQAKLTEEQVIEIRRLYALENHMTQEKIAILFGVNRATVEYIVNRKRWNHI